MAGRLCSFGNGLWAVSMFAAPAVFRFPLGEDGVQEWLVPLDATGDCGFVQMVGSCATTAGLAIADAGENAVFVVPWPESDQEFVGECFRLGLSAHMENPGGIAWVPEHGLIVCSADGASVVVIDPHKRCIDKVLHGLPLGYLNDLDYIATLLVAAADNTMVRARLDARDHIVWDSQELPGLTSVDLCFECDGQEALIATTNAGDVVVAARNTQLPLIRSSASRVPAGAVFRCGKLFILEEDYRTKSAYMCEYACQGTQWVMQKETSFC